MRDRYILFIFAPDRVRWREVIRWQSAPYKDVTGAFWAFQYGISPADAGGQWCVVVLYLNGWCSSFWSMINYTVLRPGAEPVEPIRLMESSHAIYWGSEDYGKLKVREYDFELSFYAESIDAAVLQRQYLLRYGANNKLVDRIPPIAANPQDFVDE